MADTRYGNSTDPNQKPKAWAQSRNPGFLQSGAASGWSTPPGWGQGASGSVSYNPDGTISQASYTNQQQQQGYNPAQMLGAYNQGMEGLMGGYTGQYNAETARQRAQNDFDIAWNTGEVNKNLGFGRLSNERELGLGDQNLRRDLGQMDLRGRRIESENERAYKEYETAGATQRAEIGIRPEMLGLNYQQDRFNTLAPSIQNFMGSYSNMLNTGLDGGGGGYGDTSAAGDWGFANNATVVPTQRQQGQQGPPPPNAQYYNQTAGQTGPGSPNAPQSSLGAAYMASLPKSQPQPRAPFEPNYMAPAPAAVAAPTGDPRLNQIAQISKQGNMGGVNIGAIQARGAAQQQQPTQADWMNAVPESAWGAGSGKQGSTAPAGMQYDAASGRWSGTPTAPAPAAPAATGTSPANLATSQGPSSQGGMVPRGVNGMPVNAASGALGATAWNSSGGNQLGPTGGPVLYDDLGARAFNGAPEISTAPVYGGAQQNALLGQMEAYNMNEAKNATDQMMKSRAASGMSVANSPYQKNMGRLFRNQAGINTNNQRTNMIGQFAQANANQTLAGQQARNTQYQQGLNYGLQNRQLALQNKTQNQNYKLGSFNAKTSAAQPMFQMINKYT